MIKFGKFIAVASMLTMVVPTAFGATTAELQAQINALLAQIQALQAQLAGGGVTTTTFTADLTVGSRGTEVTALQNLLISANKGASAAALAAVGATGYFGPLTKAATAEYQAVAGISPAVGYFGPITRAYVNSLAVTPTTPTTPGITTTTEGSFTVDLSASPASNANASTGANVPVYGINVRATGSDMKVDRLDLQLDVRAAGPVIYNPSSFITKISILDGSTVLTSKAISASDIYQDAALAYWTRLTGLNFVVPKDTTKTLTVSMDLVSAIDNARTVTTNVYGVQGIRAVDGLGLNSYAALAAQTINIFTAGGASVLTFSVNPNNPLSNNVVVPTTGLTEVPLLVFDAKATVDNATITSLSIVQDYTSTTGAGDPASTIKLYDGATLVGSGVASATTGSTTMSNLTISVPKDTTKTFTVKADIIGASKGSTAFVTLENSVNFKRADGITALATVPTGGIAGNPMYFFREAPILTFISAPTPVYTAASYSAGGMNIASSTADYAITYQLKAVGGAMAIVTTASTSVDIIDGAAATTAPTSANVTVAAPYDTQAVPDGATATITVNVHESSLNLADGYYGAEITRLVWTVGSTDGIHQTWGLQQLKSPLQFLP